MKQHFVRQTVLLIAIGLTVSSCASHMVLLPAVPGHAEEALTWCGPATAKMVMAGYPTSPCVKEQYEAWAEIQANRVEAVWDTDPKGLEAALENLCPPLGGGWSIFSNTDEEVLMYSVARWMTKNDYPVAALLNTQAHNSFAAHQEHWVTIKGIGTDADPTTTSTVNLQFVWFVDPAVPLGDPPLERLVAASTWYSEFQPVTKPSSSYVGKHVALIEPPETTGRAIAGSQVLTGRVVSAAQAVQNARRWIRVFRLAELEPFRGLAGAKPLEPILVNEEQGGYYLVPFSVEGDTAGLAILVNAYTGAFQEVGAFAATSFMTRRQAIETATTTLAGAGDGLQAKAVFSAAAPLSSRYRPAWQVQLPDQEALTVSMKGVVGRVTTDLPLTTREP